MVLLTQSSGFLGPIAKVLGIIFNGLFEFTKIFGIQNVGLCIILFTIVIKLLMLPLTIKQMKFSKLSMIMNPELQAIQKKYKGKTDQASMMKMQEEQKALYEKYGTSPTGGCIQLLIQMPILFALYRVIQNIPAYVSSVKVLFENMIVGPKGLMAQANFATIMAENFNANGDYETVNGIIDIMNNFKTEEWDLLMNLFPQSAALIAENAEKLNQMHNFFGINLAIPPVLMSVGILIPILTALTQWISMKTVNTNSATDSDNPAAQSMQTMNTIMPLMTGFIAVSLPAGLGLYWIATAVCQTIQQIVLNMYFDKIDMKEFVRKNVEKSNAKKKKRSSINQSDLASKVNASSRAKEISNADKVKNLQNKLEETKKSNLEKVEEIKNSASNSSGKKKSIAERANMVSNYNEKNNK